MTVQVAADRMAQQGGGKQKVSGSIWQGMYREGSQRETVPVIEGKPLRELLLRLEEKKKVKPPVQASRHTRSRLMNIGQV